MLLRLKIFLLMILSSDVVVCEDKVDNSTVMSRREIIEQQARVAYQNACYRMQELSNWMTALFRIKSVWASATVNEIASRADGISESDRKNKLGLPSRPKAASAECSLSSVQVTAQTYAYLQSQLVMMKWLLGRNIFMSGKERFGGAKERMKMLETFNSTLNGVVSKLKQNTENASTHSDSEALTARNLNYVQAEAGNFFQNLGRSLDKLIFPVAPLKTITSDEDSAVKDEHSFEGEGNPISMNEYSANSVRNSASINEHSIDNVENSATKKEHSVASIENSASKDDYSAGSVENPFIKNERSETKVAHSAAKVSTDNALMFSSIF